MVKMQIAGVVIEVFPADVDFYKRAGYSIVKDEPKPKEKAPKKTDEE